MTNKRYRLPEETIPTLAYKDHLDDITRFRNLMSSLGIGTVNTRIDRYEQYFIAMINEKHEEVESIFHGVKGKDFDHPEDRLLYLLREVHELMWILRGLDKFLPDGITEKLEEIVGGQDFAALDADSSSRNTQFELRVASYFCQSGYTVDLSTDTDIVAEGKKYNYFIECKRIASTKMLQKNFSKARDQLSNRMPRRKKGKRCFGMIAADVTKVAFDHNGLTFSKTFEHSRDIIQEKLIEISNGIDEQRCFDMNRDIILLWLQIHISAFVMYPATPTSRFSFYGIPNPAYSYGRSKILSTLQGALAIGGEEDIRMTPPRKLKLSRSVVIPAGTKFGWDEEQIEFLISTGHLDIRDQDAVVLELNMNSEDYTFLQSELEAVVSGLSESELSDLRNDSMKCRTDLLSRLYIGRFPFEE